MKTSTSTNYDSGSPLDFGVADLLATVVIYATCTVAVYLLFTYVEDNTAEAASGDHQRTSSSDDAGHRDGHSR